MVSQVFVASTHAPVLFFTSSGRVYRLKVHRLPIGTPHSRGKAMVNLLSNLAPGETITTVMPLAEDETELGGRFVVFATAKGNVRRNALSDFTSIHATGKIAMKFEGEDADDRLIAAAICTDKDDILLATRNGRCIRFPDRGQLRRLLQSNLGRRARHPAHRARATRSCRYRSLRHEDSAARIAECLPASVRASAAATAARTIPTRLDEANDGEIDDNGDEAASTVVARSPKSNMPSLPRARSSC